MRFLGFISSEREREARNGIFRPLADRSARPDYRRPTSRAPPDAWLSQGQLAESLRVSFQQVQKYERGANRISATSLMAAAQTLRVSVGWLVGEDVADQGDDEPLVRALIRPGSVELLDAFNNIADERARHALLLLACEMCDADTPAEDVI